MTVYRVPKVSLWNDIVKYLRIGSQNCINALCAVICQYRVVLIYIAVAGFHEALFLSPSAVSSPEDLVIHWKREPGVKLLTLFGLEFSWPLHYSADTRKFIWPGVTIISMYPFFDIRNTYPAAWAVGVLREFHYHAIHEEVKVMIWKLSYIQHFYIPSRTNTSVYPLWYLAIDARQNAHLCI